MKRTKKKKILFAAVDIGYRVELYTKFIQEYLSDQLEAESFSKYVLPKEHYKTNYTYTCEVNKKSKLYVYIYTFCFFIFSLIKYDVFHFLSGELLLNRKLRRFELMIYKLFGKRVIMHFVGADIRSSKYLSWKNENIHAFLRDEKSSDIPSLSEPYQLKLIREAEKYADEILVSTPDLIKIIPSAKFFPVLIDFKKFSKETDAQNQKKFSGNITILHSPSNKSLKGTKHIFEVLDRLSKKYPNKLTVLRPGLNRQKENKLYSVSRYELFELMKKSTITIDQLTIGWYGLQSIEALLLGNVVLCYIDEDLNRYSYKNCPIINVSAINLEEKLEALIKKNKELTEKTLDSYVEWVKEYHTIESNNKLLLTAWGVDHSS